MDKSVYRLPSALLPIGMSLAALGVVLADLARIHGGQSAGDGPAAYVFQILLVGQAPVVAFFAIKWLPRLPAEAMMMIGLQAGAAFLAMMPMVILDL